MTSRETKQRATEAKRVAKALMESVTLALEQRDAAGAVAAIHQAEEAQARLQDGYLSLMILAVRERMNRQGGPRRPHRRKGQLASSTSTGLCPQCGRSFRRDRLGQRLCQPCWVAGGRSGPRTVSGGLPTLGKRR